MFSTIFFTRTEYREEQLLVGTYMFLERKNISPSIFSHPYSKTILREVSDSPNTAGLDSRFLARNEEKLRKRSVFNGIPLSCVHSQQRAKAYQQLGPRHLAEQFLITPSYASL